METVLLRRAVRRRDESVKLGQARGSHLRQLPPLSSASAFALPLPQFLLLDKASSRLANNIIQLALSLYVCISRQSSRSPRSPVVHNGIAFCRAPAAIMTHPTEPRLYGFPR